MPKSKAMDAYNARAGILSAAVSNKRFATVNPLDAQAAAKPFYEFKGGAIRRARTGQIPNQAWSRPRSGEKPGDSKKVCRHIGP